MEGWDPAERAPGPRPAWLPNALVAEASSRYDPGPTAAGIKLLVLSQTPV